MSMSYEARTHKSGSPPLDLASIFQDYLHRYVHKLTIRGPRATGLCPLHEERTPSFSAHLEKCVFHCFGCGASGGVKKFAELVGEPWGATRSESRTAKAQRARLQAERQARAIFERRVEERDRVLCAEHRELYGEMLGARDLLGLFHRRPDLAAEFSELVARTEREYGDLLFCLSILEARLDGEVA
jgi:CHC2 zinc finger